MTTSNNMELHTVQNCEETNNDMLFMAVSFDLIKKFCVFFLSHHAFSNTDCTNKTDDSINNTDTQFDPTCIIKGEKSEFIINKCCSND